MTDIVAVVDAMGGDAGLAVAVPAAVRALQKKGGPGQVLLVGDQSAIEQYLDGIAVPKALREKLRVVHASAAVSMDAGVPEVLRSKEDYSMRRALELTAKNNAAVCISAGNTAALVALGRQQSNLLSGVKRLAIAAHLPTRAGNTLLLDVGATVDCGADDLHQFARMGAALAEALRFADQPSVRCLSVGSEEGKGNRLVKETVALLQSDKTLAYEGLVEGDGLYSGDCEVVVCDGFTGNIALKSSEGTARYIRQVAVERLAGSDWDGSADTSDKFQTLMGEINPSRYNGAVLMGLDILVVKSHGGASEDAFLAAIEKGVRAADNALIASVSKRLI